MLNWLAIVSSHWCLARSEFAGLQPDAIASSWLRDVLQNSWLD